MFIDRAERDLSATVLGVEMPAPIILGPVGGQALAHPDGEAATARAAAALGLTYVHSSQSSTSVESVAAAAPTGSRWFGLDWPDADGPDLALLERAQLTGCTHLVLSPPQPGKGWAALAAIRDAWDGPIILSGIQTVPDARKAVRRGFDGIVVSNERGRRRPRPAGTIDVLAADRGRGRRQGPRPVRLGRPHGDRRLPGAGPGGRGRRHRPPVRARPGARRGGGRPAHAPHAPRRARHHPRHRRGREPPRARPRARSSGTTSPSCDSPPRAAASCSSSSGPRC